MYTTHNYKQSFQYDIKVVPSFVTYFVTNSWLGHDFFARWISFDFVSQTFSSKQYRLQHFSSPSICFSLATIVQSEYLWSYSVIVVSFKHFFFLEAIAHSGHFCSPTISMASEHFCSSGSLTSSDL